MFRRKTRGKHAAPTPTSAYVVRGAMIAGATPALITATAITAQADTGNIPLVKVQAAPSAQEPVSVAQPAAPAEYVVKSGDTLGKIAKANETTVQAIAERNNISNPNVITVGQKISLGDSPIFEELARETDARSVVVEEAKKYLDVPYEYGGMSSSGLDCSGLTSLAYKAAGISVPRVSSAQAAAFPTVSEQDARPGDLVAFDDGTRVHHVGILVADNEIIHAPRRGERVQITKIWRGEKVTFHRVA